uniref:Uncharacterized protein n=1 Tax=Cucumis sativus TaxID=3659 RepID=A0A0A0LM28_CUCSA
MKKRSYHLSSEHDEQSRNKSELSLVKKLNSSQNMRSINRASTRIGKNSNQNMLLYIEGSRIHSKLKPCAFEKLLSWKRLGQQMTKRHNSNLCSNRRYRQWVRSVPEKLVHKREYYTSRNPQNPHSECENWQVGVIGFGYRNIDLLDRTRIVNCHLGRFCTLNLRYNTTRHCNQCAR